MKSIGVGSTINDNIWNSTPSNKIYVREALTERAKDDKKDQRVNICLKLSHYILIRRTLQRKGLRIYFQYQPSKRM
jgi:hypothetical protein